jgi:hypothetical protein
MIAMVNREAGFSFEDHLTFEIALLHRNTKPGRIQRGSPHGMILPHGDAVAGRFALYRRRGFSV